MAWHPAKLLSVLQDKTIQRLGGGQTIDVDVRIIGSTHRDMEKSVLQAQFNEELYFLLNRQRICVPPLRAHSDDIPALVKYFERKYHRESERWTPSFGQENAEIKLGSQALLD